MVMFQLGENVENTNALRGLILSPFRKTLFSLLHRHALVSLLIYVNTLNVKVSRILMHRFGIHSL